MSCKSEVCSALDTSGRVYGLDPNSSYYLTQMLRVIVDIANGILCVQSLKCWPLDGDNDIDVPQDLETLVI